MAGYALLLDYLDDVMEPLSQKNGVLPCRGFSKVFALSQTGELTLVHPAGHMLILVILLAYAWLDKLVTVVSQRVQQFLFVDFSFFTLIIFLQKSLILPRTCLRGEMKFASGAFSIVQVDSEGILTKLIHNGVFNEHHSFSIRAYFGRRLFNVKDFLRSTHAGEVDG